MIRAYEGLMGQGKTLSMVQDAHAVVVSEWRQVKTNMASLKFPEAEYCDSLEEVFSSENCVALLDEAAVVMNSRKWQTLSATVMQKAVLSRKNGTDIWYTTQSLGKVDTYVTSITAEVVKTRMLGQGLARCMFQIAYDPQAKVRLWWRLRPVDPRFFRLYDTFELVRYDGGSGGRGAHNDTTLRGRRQAARKASVSVERVNIWRLWRGVDDDSSSSLSDLTSEASSALLWLRERGRGNGDGWADELREEVQRRRWLAMFKLDPNDVAECITYKNPWFPGASPDEVQAEREREEARGAADTILKFAEKKAAGGRR